jgi:hypothetical protein
MKNEVNETLVDDISFEDLQKLATEGVVPSVEVTPKSAPEPAPVAEPEPVAAAAEPPAVEPEPKPEAEGSTAEPKQEPEPEKKKWWDKRLSSQARKIDQLKTDVQAEHSRAEQLARELEAQKTAQPGPKPQAAEQPATGKPKPQLKEFVAALDAEKGEEYDLAVERFTDAITDWKDEQRTAKAEQKTQAAAQQTQVQAFQKDLAAAVEETPDFEEVRDRVCAVAPEGLQIAISQVQDEAGKNLWPKLTLYFDENPAELEALSTQFKQNPYAATSKLGRIAATLFPVQTPTPPAKIPPKTSPKVVKPPTAVGGTGTPAEVDINETKDLAVVGRELKKLGLEIPGF